jgi:putative transposase
LFGGGDRTHAGARSLDRMARPLRNFGPSLYHVTSHASDDRELFLVAEDRSSFLQRLARICKRFELELVSFVLMGNHYHAIMRTPDERLSTGLQVLHTGYSRHHNRVHGRSAHLFKAHFGSREIVSDEQLLNTVRYLALNPVEAGFVEHPLDWPWGSARAHAGLEPPLIPLEEGPIRAAFDDRDGWRESFEP